MSDGTERLQSVSLVTHLNKCVVIENTTEQQLITVHNVTHQRPSSIDPDSWLSARYSSDNEDMPLIERWIEPVSLQLIMISVQEAHRCWHTRQGDASPASPTQTAHNCLRAPGVTLKRRPYC